MNLTSHLTPGASALASVAAPIGFASAGSLGADQLTSPACGAGLFGDEFVHTDLIFGLSGLGGRIGERQFDCFVDGEVTPRFPDGLTGLSGVGPFRLGGEIIEEFDQQSVLRTDEPTCVSF